MARPVRFADAAPDPPVTDRVPTEGVFSATPLRLNVTVRGVDAPAANVPAAGDTANGEPALAAQATGSPPGFDKVTVTALADVPKSSSAVDSASCPGAGGIVVVCPGTMNGCVVEVAAGGAVTGGSVTGGSVTGGSVIGGGRIVVAVVTVGGNTAKTVVAVDGAEVVVVDEVVEVDDVDDVDVDDVDVDDVEDVEVLVVDELVPGVLELVGDGPIVVSAPTVVVAPVVVAPVVVAPVVVVEMPNVVEGAAGARYSGSPLAASR